MSRNDRTILLVVPLVAALVAFWFLVLSPKQNQASKLDTQVSGLQTQLQSEQQAAQQGQRARKSFPQDYHRLVVMGKAVPVDDETASLIVQINKIADRSGVSFQAIDLSQGSSTAGGLVGPTPTATAPTTAPTTTTPTSTGSSSTSSSTPSTPASSTTSTTPSSSSTSSSSSTTPSTSGSAAAPATAAPTTSAPATESSAALLPIGATVGSANLPTLPYAMTFQGNYFQIANFMAGVDKLVSTGKGAVQADGRLATIDAFQMAPGTNTPPGILVTNLAITTYVTPASQGLTAGATPTGPAPTPLEQASSTVASSNTAATAASSTSP